MKIVGYLVYVIAFIDFALSWIDFDITYWLLGSFSAFSPFIFAGIGTLIISFSGRSESVEDSDN